MKQRDIDVDAIRPHEDFLLLSKCYRPHKTDKTGRVLIFMPEKIRDNSEWFEILAIGPRCEIFDESDIGMLVRSKIEPGEGNLDIRLVSDDDLDENGERREIWLMREKAKQDAIDPLDHFTIDPHADQE